MERGGGVDEIAEVVVQVGFTVVVEVDQAGDLVFAVDEDLSIPNRQSQSFEQAGGESLPADLAHFAKAFHKPDITIPSADGGGVVVDKVETTNAHVRVPGVLEGHGDVIHHERFVTVLCDIGLDDDFFGIDRREQRRIRLASRKHPSEQSLRRGGGSKDAGFDAITCRGDRHHDRAGRAVDGGVKVQDEGCSRDLEGGPVASPNGKSRVSDPCAASIGKHFDALVSGGVGHADVHAFRGGGGEDL